MTDDWRGKYYVLTYSSSHITIKHQYTFSKPLPDGKAIDTFVFQALKSVVLYVILSPYDNEQSDLVHRISEDKKLEEIPKYK